MEVLKDCYLFNGCKARFLDQVLAAVRMELFMPNVSKLLDRCVMGNPCAHHGGCVRATRNQGGVVPVLNEGDVCNELFLIVDGEVATSAPVNRSARRNSMMGPYDNGPNLDPEFLAGAQAASGTRSQPTVLGHVFASKCATQAHERPEGVGLSTSVRYCRGQFKNVPPRHMKGHKV
eukprot:1156566-Pelagomonas_calceolata.AAC.1